MPQNNFNGYPGVQGYYPTGYPTQPQQTFPNQMPSEQKGITTVSTVPSKESADNYPVAAGQTACLLNFQTPSSGVFWLKTTDIYGRNIPMVEFEFNQKSDIPQGTAQQNTNPSPQQIPNQNDFVSKQDFDEVKNMMTELYRELKGTN